MKMQEACALMGQVVTVTHELRRTREGLSKNWKPKDVCRTGWVTGIRYLQNGHTDPGSWEEPSEWITESVTPCVLVTYWPNRKPVPVPLDGFRVGGDAPTRDPSQRPWKMEDREYMRNAMKDVRRDARGRWME